MNDPIHLARELLYNWEENCRDLFEDGPFGADQADWSSLQGVVFHEVILPLLLVTSAEEELPWAADRDCEAAALRALSRIPARQPEVEPRRGRAIGRGASRLRRLLRSLWSLRHRPAPRSGLLVVAENAQGGGESDPFYSGLLPAEARTCWLSTRDGRLPADDLRFDDALLRAALGPLRGMKRYYQEFFREGCQALARRVQIPGLPGSPELTALVGQQLAEAIRYQAHARQAARILLEQTRPDQILLYAEYAAPQYQLLTEARRLGIRSVAIQHGDIVDGLSSGLLHPILDTTQRPDLTLVTGEAHAEELQRAGYPEGSVRVSGHLWRGLARSRPVPDPDGPVLVFSQSFLSSACRARFFNSIRRLPGDNLQVKLHPYERLGLPESYLPAGAEILEGNQTAFEAMHGKSLVIGGSSTALLEAWALGFPVLHIESLGDRIRHEDLRRAIPRVPAGSDPSEALTKVRAAVFPPEGPIERYYSPRPDPRILQQALER